VLDGISTRLQGGFKLSQALWGIKSKTNKVKDVVARFQRRTGHSKLFTRAALLNRSNLYAGVRVVIAGRFPYLFVNFSTYAKTEAWVLQGEDRLKTLRETMTCIIASTLTSSSIITAIECPKIMDQMAGAGTGQKRTTILSVVRQFGIRRVLQGYDATFCREFLFNCALLGSPSLADFIHQSFIEPNVEDSAIARFLDGKQLMLACLCMGFPIGYITNVPDQLKTRIQHGQFTNLIAASRWQAAKGGGIRALLGRAALYRSMYICHGVLFLNIARAKVSSKIQRFAPSATMLDFGFTQLCFVVFVVCTGDRTSVVRLRGIPLSKLGILLCVISCASANSQLAFQLHRLKQTNCFAARSNVWLLARDCAVSNPLPSTFQTERANTANNEKDFATRGKDIFSPIIDK